MDKGGSHKGYFLLTSLVLLFLCLGFWRIVGNFSFLLCAAKVCRALLLWTELMDLFKSKV